ncbi:2Fe-2S iron-sulfur cluster binding domain-containing protein [Heliobacterium gestii]|uniref:2Fe-2S iron-sulfur cluster binding domain-containing protein n=1 Tax=Heliomicrobium gestii TaxID=2699 RepID=A0A845LE15_HELGE|nr:2Fe-2S iron-sulfur cluster-binding protein [Heliomicrobium gestii]MBM7866346.1 ferredoxin [Heliomicrobium gestii]MZP42869.1 2Fe-2S iron-sulfur cluster binding domain-containing protein [Heliomicrobium gestii]
MIPVVFVTPHGDVTVEAAEGVTLLEAGQANGVEIEYSCKDGRCGVCQVTLLEGEANLSEPDIDEVDELFDRIDDGVRLACKARILGPVKVRIR